MLKVNIKRGLMLVLFILGGYCNGFELVPEYDSNNAEVSAQQKGIVRNKVKLGDKVKKGQLLFELDSSILDSEKVYGKSHLKIMKTIFERAKLLMEKKAISYQHFQSCIKGYFNAQLRLNLVKSNIASTKYYAPLDGTVTAVVRGEGSATEDNTPQIIITKGDVKVDTSKTVIEMCNRWPALLDVKVNIGEKVKKGQLLFTVFDSPFKDQIEIDKNKATLAKKEYERLKKLRETNTSSYTELLEAQDLYYKALYDIEVSKIKLRQCSIKSPVNGTITRIYRYTGSGLGEGKPVVQVAVD